MALPRLRLSGDERRSEIIRHAVRLAASSSPDRITTQQIASEMGVTQGAVFRNFATKDDIWVAALEWVGDELMRRVSGAAEAADDPVAALRGVFEAHMDFVAEFPGVPRLLFHELQQVQDSRIKEAIRAILARYQAHLVRLLQGAIAEKRVGGELRPMDAATLFVGMVQGLVIRSLLLRTDPRENAHDIFRLYLRAIGAAQS